jgi:hypothetical protein
LRKGNSDLMQHNHQNATKSDRADRIEQEIDSGLQRLQLLINELRLRIAQKFQPEKLVQKRWVWLIFVSLVCLLKLRYLVKNMEKRRWLSISINHHHWHHILFFQGKKTKR